MINDYSDQAIAPIIIDTPNQQEQSPENYDKILLSINKKIPQSAQIILCALKNQKLEGIKVGANVINLDDNKLLSSEKFNEISIEFDKYKISHLLQDSHEENDASLEED